MKNKKSGAGKRAPQHPAEKRRLSAELQQLARTYSHLFYRAADAILIWDGNGLIRNANEAACVLTGYDKNALLGRLCFELFPEHIQPSLKDTLKKASKKADGSVLLETESTLLGNNGRAVPVMLRTSVAKYEQELSILAIAHDLRDLKELEAKLASSRARYEEIVENVNEVIVILGRDGIIKFINSAGEQTLETARKELTGMDIRKALHPEDHEKLSDVLTAETAGLAGQPRTLRMISATGKELEFTVSTTLMPGEADGSGNILGILRDVTGQREIQERLRYAERMRSLGEMLSKITHEVKNPLAAIHASTEFLKRHWDADDESKQEVVNMIADEVNRLNGIITEFLRIRRIPRPTMIDHDIEPVISHVVRSLDMLLHEKPGIKITSSVGPATFKFDADMTKQVMWNLLNNAMDAVGEEGTIKVTGAVQPDNGIYEIKVADSGCGMKPEEAQTAFEPFVTTKKTGSGLGLTLVKTHVEAMGGIIYIKTRLGRGTAVHIQLPV